MLSSQKCGAELSDVERRRRTSSYYSELLTQETQVAESRLLNKYLKPDLLIID
jgi:hypothetical protein